jgi:hypothetical protein
VAVRASLLGHCGINAGCFGSFGKVNLTPIRTEYADLRELNDRSKRVQTWTLIAQVAPKQFWQVEHFR